MGEPVVLVPGGLTGWLSWILHQERLAARYRAIRVQPIHNELGSAGVPGDPEYTAVTERESLRLTLDALGLERPHLVGWSGGGKSALELAMEYPTRLRSLTLVEPAAYWILEQLGDSLDEVAQANTLVHRLFGREVTDDDLAEFLQVAGFVPSADRATSHPNWERWLGHRMALSWQGEAVDHPHRTVKELTNVTCPTLLTKGAQTSPWLKRVVDVLGDRLTDATVTEFDGDHAHHIERIDAFLTALEAHMAHVDGPAHAGTL
ncbi:alpha/beta fold hydrolase [Mycetocola sp.]|uniref:alpha/beta fold hydrolase n=1 Tax=Mycetocola sp. TaxID=1871042 RepID=UPI003989FB95